MDNVIVAAHCADNTADQLNYSLEILENNLIHYCRDVERGGDGRKDLIISLNFFCFFLRVIIFLST